MCLSVGASAASAQSLYFTDVTEAAGVTCVHDVPFPLEKGKYTGGVAAGDFNADGWTDLFVLLGGIESDRLFINNGDGTFTEASAAWGVDYVHMAASISVGDYDGNGAVDMFVTGIAGGDGFPTPGIHRLYRNNADGTFSEVAEAAGVDTTSLSHGDGFGSAFGDYDVDGDLDLFVTSWEIDPQGNRLFRNNGDGTFEDVTLTAILTNLTPLRGFAPRFADLDGDRLPELIIAGDFFTSLYLLNMGDGTFIDYTDESGTGTASNGMGSALGDIDGDGLLDWYVTSIWPGPGFPNQTGNKLFRNLGRHEFEEIAENVGVQDGGWGWGAEMADFNNDGKTDIIEVNGWLNQFEAEQIYLWLNQGDLILVESALQSGLDWPSQGRAVITLDYDRDGDLDLAIASNQQPFKLFRNDLSGAGANWLRVRLGRGTDRLVAPDGFGTRVEVVTASGTQVRYLDGGETYLGQSELTVHFGLGAETLVDTLTVHWAPGGQKVLTDVPANQEILIEACGADANGDGQLNVLDFIAFQIGFSAQTLASDCNADGVWNVIDFVCFQGTFSDGCP